MDPHNATTLLHLVGFVTALALYVMLAAMTAGAARRGADGQRRMDRIPLATAALGIVWNAGALVMYGLPGITTAAWLPVLAFTALYFLPAVVVHSALTTVPRTPGRVQTASAFIAAAYVLSGGAALINVAAAIRHEAVPSRPGLWALAAGYAAIIGLLVLYSRRQPAWRRALPIVALAAFAAMVVHLSHHSATSDTWPVELLGHHASLPLVLVILYQDYRFALADLFLKRVVTLLAVTGIAAVLYSTVVVPVVLPKLGAPAGNPLAAALLITLWVGTALIYPAVRVTVARFVDRAILGRSDTQALLTDLGTDTATLNAEDAILDAACAALAPALSATRVTWTIADPPDDAGAASGRDARVRVPVIDSPGYWLTIGPLRGGRRLLSDDQTLLDGVARLAARRIDGVRVARERFARDIRERDMQQLATEAELRALRAQINPHFLFNALTTIGYLVRAAPDRAIETLLRLTDVLRAVLKRSDGEFATLGEEMEIVTAYLEIERARFEDRLAVTIDVPDSLMGLRVPPLVLQPLIENAVKHGIAPLVAGGRITVTARTEGEKSTSGSRPDARWLHLTVADTGTGAEPAELARRRRSGIGLTNIERRLARHYGADALIDVRTALGVGTTVDVRLPATFGPAMSGPAPRPAIPSRTQSATP